jgi:hypothetical protein
MDGGTLRVLGIPGVVDADGRRRLVSRLEATALERVEDVPVAGHSAERYRGADGADVVTWSCPGRRATFVALGDARLVAGVACHP